MRSQYILSYLRAAVLALDLPGVGPDAIAYPNRIADLGALPISFELHASDFTTAQETERSAVTRCVGSIAVSVPLGLGIERADSIAQALVDRFAFYNPNRDKGAAQIERVAGTKGAFRRSRLYPAKVERSNGTVVDGRYKIMILVTLDIYEEEL